MTRPTCCKILPGHRRSRRSPITFPRVSQAVSDGTRRVYSTYWNRVVEAWGPRLITSVSPLEISQLAEDIKANVVPRRNARGGRGAAEHLIGALRCMYNHAVADRLLSEAENPAARVPKPRRLPSARMALPDGRLDRNQPPLPHPRATTRPLTR